eukprot:TRINITY_DN1648_c0_g1_i1.p1 TRINITY_DN1648_c0_g1~~TRINITY_DN1648_c0_g1_i1.p1  ORF type:complete len:296 (-),score=61.75 TRINITY_DN1648_c0_g1_i1:65-952(-)
MASKKSISLTTCLLVFVLASVPVLCVRRDAAEVQEHLQDERKEEKKAENKEETKGHPPHPRFAHLLSLEVGNVQSGGALVPKLVPPPGTHYEFKVKEPTVILDEDEYKWILEEANGQDIDMKIAKLKGSFNSNTFGHHSVHVKDKTDKEIFKIRQSKHVMNPLSWRWSFRILPPGSKSNDDSMFTINKDKFGTGILFMRQEWWIWRGRERDQDLAYYCVGSYRGGDWKFYKSKEAHENKEEPVAEIEQQDTRHIWGNDMVEYGDEYVLWVEPGEDSALLLAAVTIIDMVQDEGKR